MQYGIEGSYTREGSRRYSDVPCIHTCEGSRRYSDVPCIHTYSKIAGEIMRGSYKMGEGGSTEIKNTSND